MPAAIPLALAALAAAGTTTATAAPAVAAAAPAIAGAAGTAGTIGTAVGTGAGIASEALKTLSPQGAPSLPKAGLTGGGPLKSPTGTPVTQVGGGIAPQTSQNLAPDSGGGDLGAVIKQAIQQILSGGDTSQEATT